LIAAASRSLHPPADYIEENVGEVRFVPLLGAEGWPVQAN
jgi:hypothetical protein